MCVDVLKLSPILFNDTNLSPFQSATVAVGWKMPPKIGDEIFDPKNLGRNWQPTLFLTDRSGWNYLT